MNTNAILKNTLVFGLFAILFIPFIVANHQFFPFITGKAFVFRIAVEILFGIWIFLSIRDRSFLPKFSWITGAILIFVGIIAIADIFGANPYKSFWSNFERMEGLITLIHLGMYFLVASSVLSKESLWTKFFNTSVIASALVCFYSFFQLAGKITINQGGVRVDATFGNATYLAVYLLINMFLAIFLFVRVKENLYLRIAYVAIFIMQGVVLFQTATRGAILGFIGGAALSALIVAIFVKENKKARIAGLVVFAVIVLALGGFMLARQSEFVKNNLTLSRFASLSAESIKSQGRYYVWPMALEGFKERPILGWGQENFSYVFNKNYNPKMYTQEPWFDRTHNIFLDWLVSGGLLGLLAYLALYVALLFYLWRGKNNFSLIDRAVLTGLIAAYVFQNIFVFDNLISYIMFFSILAFIHAMNTEGKEPIKWISRVTANTGTAERIAGPVILVLLISSLYFLNTKPILANRTLIRAIDARQSTPEQSLENFRKVFAYNTFGSTEAREQLITLFGKFSAAGVKPETKSDFVKLGKDQMLIQVDATPRDTRTLLFTGGFLSQIGEYQNAIDYFERARETSPRKQGVYFGMGGAYLGLGTSEYPKALETFKKAYELEPSFPEAKLIYAVGAIYNRNDKLAAELLSSIEPRQVLFDDRILSAYYAIGRFGEVLKILQLRVEVEPNNSQLRFQLAAAYFQVGDKTNSIKELKKAIEIDPKIKDQAEYIIKEIQAGRNPLSQ